MVRLMTLKGLEATAKRRFDEQADAWVKAIAIQEGISPGELRPHLVSMSCEKLKVKIVFVIPEHTPIKFLSSWHDVALDRVVRLEDGKLIGDYEWYAFCIDYTYNRRCFMRAKNLGHALLLSRQAFNGKMGNR